MKPETGSFAKTIPFVSWVAVLIILHVTKIFYLFRQIDFRSPLPILNGDYALYFARALRVREFFHISGRFWGYDPYQMAGYVAGPVHELGSHFISFLAYALSGLVPIGQSVLWMEIIGFLGTPFLMLAVVRNFGGSRDQQWGAFGLTVLFHGTYEVISSTALPLSLFSFNVASFLSLCHVSLVWAWLHRRDQLAYFVMAGLSLVLFLIHPASLVILVLPEALILFMEWKNVGWRNGFWAAGLVVVVGLVNIPWLSPYLHFLEWKTNAPYYATGWGLLSDVFSLIQPSAYHYVRTLLHLGLLSLTVMWLVTLKKSNSPLFWVMAPWFIVLGTMSYFGSSFPLVRSLQPERFKIPFWLLTVIGASFYSGALFHQHRFKLATGVALLMGLCIFGPPQLGFGTYTARPFHNTWSDDQAQLLVVIGARSPAEGRFLFESNDAGDPRYFCFGDLAATLTRRPMLGGGNNGNFLKTRYTLFSGQYMNGLQIEGNRPLLFGRPLAEMEGKEFEKILQEFNVTHLGVTNPLTKNLLQRFASLIELDQELGPVSVYRFKKPSTWFLKGSGEVSFDFDRIKINDLAPGENILKCHWLDTLQTDPPVQISPAPVGTNPVPFIAVQNDQGLNTLTIINGGL